VRGARRPKVANSPLHPRLTPAAAHKNGAHDTQHCCMCLCLSASLIDFAGFGCERFVNVHVDAAAAAAIVVVLLCCCCFVTVLVSWLLFLLLLLVLRCCCVDDAAAVLAAVFDGVVVFLLTQLQAFDGAVRVVKVRLLLLLLLSLHIARNAPDSV